jgi:hypothetical protein
VRVRRLLVLLASATLVFFFLRSAPLRDLALRVESLRHYASQDLAVRRLGGSAAAFDRHYFILLEWARRRLPPGARGIAVFPDKEIPSRGKYLTIYQFAPLPTEVAPAVVPAGWLALIYGPRRPQGWRVVENLPYGALLEPAP